MTKARIIKSIRVLLLSLIIVMVLPLSGSSQNLQNEDLETTAKNGTDINPKKYTDMFEETFRFILDNYVDKPDSKKLFDGAMKGLLESLGDPYSVYLTGRSEADINDILTGGFGGIGLYIEKEAATPGSPAETPIYITVVSPIEDTPGWKAGINAGDLITKINGEDTSTMTIDTALGKLRGKIGVTVLLTIKRGKLKPFDISITRAKIEVPTIKFASIPYMDKKIAYLKIITFSVQTRNRFVEAIKSFNTSSFDALIIDVRYNGGGLLDSAVKIADDLLDHGVIVTTKGRRPNDVQAFVADKNTLIPTSKPIVLILNKASASASEILAGALKDNKRAYLIGDTSFGKGVVQQVYSVGSNEYKMTIARYYTPSDENIDKTGIPPDLISKEPDLSEAQNLSAQKLLETGKIQKWVKENENPSKEQRNIFADSLTGYNLPSNVLRIMVYNEVQKTKISPIYNLEFDTALNTSLKTIVRSDFNTLLSNAKSVKSLVDAQKTKVDSTKKSP